MASGVDWQHANAGFLIEANGALNELENALASVRAIAGQITNFGGIETLNHVLRIQSRASFIRKKLEGGTNSVMPYKRLSNPSQSPLIDSLIEVETLLDEVDRAIEECRRHSALTHPLRAGGEIENGLAVRARSIMLNAKVWASRIGGAQRVQVAKEGGIVPL